MAVGNATRNVEGAVFASWRRDDRTTCSLSSQWRWEM